MTSKNSTKDWKHYYKECFGEEFKVFNSYLIGSKGTIFSDKLKRVDGEDVIKIKGKSYRRKSVLEYNWPKDKTTKPIIPIVIKSTKKINSTSNKNLWRSYLYQVRKLTDLQPLHKMKDFDKRSFGNYHVDHIMSIKYCWKNNISIEECSSICNLQMLTKEENESKRNQCYSVINQCEHIRLHYEANV